MATIVSVVNETNSSNSLKRGDLMILKKQEDAYIVVVTGYKDGLFSGTVVGPSIAKPFGYHADAFVVSAFERFTGIVTLETD